MPTEEEKKANQVARDAIKVSGTKQPDAAVPDPAAEVKAANAAVEEPIVEEAETAEVEEVVEQVEASEEKVEELEEELEDKTLTAKERERLEKRIQKEREKNRDLRVELEAAKKQLGARPEDEKVYTEDEIERRADEKAALKTAELNFESQVNRIADEAGKIDKSFQKKINALSEEMGSLIPPTMINILDELPKHGADVLLYLANEDNYEEAEGVWNLTPARMALRLQKISDKLKPKPKPISKVPPTNERLNGRGTTPDVLNPKNMDEFVRIRGQQQEAFRRKKMGLAH